MAGFAGQDQRTGCRLRGGALQWSGAQIHEPRPMLQN